MRIRFLQDYRVHAAGAEYDHPFPGVAEELVRRGVAAVAAPAAKPRLAAPQPAPQPPPERRKKS